MAPRLSPSLVVSGIALVLAAGGIGVGAGAWITGDDIRDGSITGEDIRDGSIGTRELALGAVTKNRMAPGARLALRKAGTPGPAGAQGPAGTTGAAGAQGERGSGGSGGSGGGFAETFTQAGPITVLSGSAGYEPFSLDRPVAWTTPAGAIDTVRVTAKIAAGACTGDKRLGVGVTVDGTATQPWYENVLWVVPSATSSWADEVVSLGPGSHSLTNFGLLAATTGCTMAVTDVVVAVSRTG